MSEIKGLSAGRVEGAAGGCRDRREEGRSGVRLVDPATVDPAIRAWWLARSAEAEARRAAERARETAGEGRGAWHLVQTVPRGEAAAAAALAEAGFGVFLPRYRVDVPFGRAVRGKMRPVKTIERALFAGYLFVRVEPGQGCYGVTKARGVARLVTWGDGPAVVPDAVVAVLVSSADKAGLMASPAGEGDDAVAWALGEVVRLIEGPFAGFEGPVTGVDGRGDVRVDLAVFGRTVAVTAPSGQIEASRKRGRRSSGLRR